VKNFLPKLYLVLIFIFLYAPIAVLIVFSFNSARSTMVWDGFSLKWYKELFSDRQIIRALVNTVAIALLASLFSLVFGTLGAIGIHKMTPLRKRMTLMVNNIPVLNPDIVTGVALMTLFLFCRMKLGFVTLLLSHITFCVPYVILSILPKLRALPREMVEAALDLGATPFGALRKIVLPEIFPGILSGTLIAFTLSIDDFVISFFTTGSGVSNLSILVYSMARRGINPKINAVSTLLFAVVLVLLLAINRKDSVIKNMEV
jgi:spermidine/putrescine transport system permease protein